MIPPQTSAGQSRNGAAARIAGARRPRVGHAPRRRFLFPARVTRLSRPGPRGLTGAAQRTGPPRPVTTVPTATQARTGSRNRRTLRRRGPPVYAHAREPATGGRPAMDRRGPGSGRSARRPAAKTASSDSAGSPDDGRIDEWLPRGRDQCRDGSHGPGRSRATRRGAGPLRRPTAASRRTSGYGCRPLPARWSRSRRRCEGSDRARRPSRGPRRRPPPGAARRRNPRRSR